MSDIEFELKLKRIEQRAVAFSEIDLLGCEQLNQRIAQLFGLAGELDYTTEAYYPMVVALLPKHISYMVLPKTFYTVIAFDFLTMNAGNDLTKSSGKTLGEALCRAILKLYQYQNELEQQARERKKESKASWIQKLLPKPLLRQ